MWDDNIYACVCAGNERYSKLSILTKLYSIKCKRGASDATMSDVIELLSDAFYNIGDELPSSFYEAKKTITKMGVGYIKINTCLYDCMLFWSADAALD